MKRPKQFAYFMILCVFNPRKKMLAYYCIIQIIVLTLWRKGKKRFGIVCV